MDILFSRTYKYTIEKPIINVQQEFSQVTNKKWSDFSSNITGKLNEDNTFKFTHKWTFGYIRGPFGHNFATIKGIISESGQNTVVEATVKPNLGLVFFLYFITGLFLCEILGIKTILNGPKTYILLFLPFFGLLLFGLIHFMTNGLRNTFEKCFHLKAD